MKYYAQGMHCPSCPILIEGELGDLPGVSAVKADLATRTVEVTSTLDLAALNAPLAKHGYCLTTEPTIAPVAWKDFYIALPIAATFIVLFVILQKLGIINWIQAGEVTYSTAFIIGIVASLSTCMAVVGGLILSLSATFSKQDLGWRPAVLFHVGRLITFFVLGGVIGVIGSQFQINSTMTFILSFIVGIVLLLLGVNLLDIFPWAKKLQPTLPKQLANRLLTIKQLNSWVTPILLGVVTFFLPCGFTQSMQLYTLTTGNFMTGAFTMLVFALGTLPVLALLSFSSVGMTKPSTRSIFFKAAGVIVIFFAVINIISGLISVGFIPPILNF